MNNVLIGNICSFGAMVTNSISGTRKKHKEMLGIQIISFVFYSASSIILKAYSSTVQNGVGIMRNLAAIKEIKNKTLKTVIEWTLISLGVILGVVFNNRGFIGWLPIVANFEYSIAVFKLKNNTVLLRIAFIVNLIMYTVFSAVIMDYVSIAANLIAAVTTVVFLVKERRGKKNEVNEEIEKEA